MKHDKDSIKVKSLYKSLKIMQCFTSAKDELGITEIARMLDLSKSNVYNIISTLVELGYVEQNPSTGKYHLGIRVLEFSYVVTSRIAYQSIVISKLQQLSDEFNVLAYFGVPLDTFVLYLYNTYSHNTTNEFYIRSIMGEKAPLYCTALGKAILSTMEEAEIKQRIDMPKKDFTSRTICETQSILEEIEKTKKRGYAIDDMEHEEGIRCIGIPVMANNGTLFGGLSVSGPISRLPWNIADKIAERLHEAAFEIKSHL